MFSEILMFFVTAMTVYTKQEKSKLSIFSASHLINTFLTTSRDHLAHYYTPLKIRLWPQNKKILKEQSQQQQRL